MSIRIVLRYLGILIAVFGGLLGVPLFWSVVMARDGAHMAFLVPMAVAVPVGLALYRFTPVDRRSLSRREGLTLVVFTWLSGALLGAMPYMLSGTLPGFVDALFEATSGITTTGATVLSPIGWQAPSILLWRNFSQWLGAMGIITFFVALFPMLGIGAARLFEAEMPGPQPERFRPRMMDTARFLWSLYMAFSLILFVLLRVGARLPLYDALNLTFSTIATGGFLHLPDSAAAYVGTPYITTVMTVFMLIGGVNFSLYYRALRSKRPGTLLANAEFRLYMGLFALGTGAIAVDLALEEGLSAGRALQYAAFQAASMQTTSGFVIADYDLWPALSRSVLLVLMVVGGCAGSTSGGLKVVRLLVVLKDAYRQVVATFSPRSVMPLKLGGDAVSEPVVSGIVGLASLYVLTLAAGFVFMSALGLDAVTAFSAVAASMGNVGPGFGGVGAVQSYVLIPDAGKLVLAGLMLVGRLEFVTALALVSPPFWRWR